MSDNIIRVPARSLKEQFSRGSEAWKEQPRDESGLFKHLPGLESRGRTNPA